MSDLVVQSDLDLPLLHRGKVRDVYHVDDRRLLMVASDRVSAFDVVMSRPIPRKGEVLTQITAWWLDRLEREGIEHHLISVDPDVIAEEVPSLASTRDRWAHRSMLVRRTRPVLVECVVRAYLSGSAWREYRDHGTLAGEPLPGGLVESGRLPTLLFSPATKASEGHDENITPDQVRERLGGELTDRLTQLSFQIFRHGAATCERRDVILADTKFEFGHDPDGRLLLIDEVMTPDSSRFWPREHYQPGRPQPSLDKQPLRDWLDGLPDWDKAPPPPPMPDEVVTASSERYLEAFERLTGTALDDHLGGGRS